MLQVDGFGITPYRSFAGDIQYVGPLTKINLIIGQNNSGKSNILQFVTHHLEGIVTSAVRGTGYSRFEQLDRHLGIGEGALTFAYGLDPGSSVVENARKDFNPHARAALDKLLNSKLLLGQGNIAWFLFEVSSGNTRLSPGFVDDAIQAEILNHFEWQALWTTMTQSSRGDLKEHWVPQTLHAVAALALKREFPKISFVPAIREVQDENQKSEGGFSGHGLIAQLAELERPGHADQELKKKFAAINELLREVTGSDSATIEIPAKRDTITVHMEGRPLPLKALGTGIHEVVILAAAATTVSDALICTQLLQKLGCVSDQAAIATAFL